MYIRMRFAWDEPKSSSNRKKHGVSFDTAARVLLDPLHLTARIGSRRRTAPANYWYVMSPACASRLRRSGEQEEVIRIISARRTTRQERIEYEEASEI